MRALLVMSIVGCGRVGFDQRDDARSMPGGDSVSPGDGLAAPMCGSTVLLRDDFVAAPAGPTFTATAGAGLVLSEMGGQFVVTFLATVNGGNYGWYRSAASFPRDGLCAVIEVVGVPGNGGMGYWKVDNQPSNQTLEFVIWNDTLDMRTQRGVMVNTIASIPFDPVAHRFLQLRFQGGVGYWDVSSNGSDFIPQASSSVFTDPTLYVEAGGGAFTTVNNGGAATFERVDVTGP